MKDTKYIRLLKKLFSSFFKSKDGISTTHIFCLRLLQLFDSNIDGTPPLSCFSPTKDEVIEFKPVNEYILGYNLYRVDSSFNISIFIDIPQA